MHGRLVDVRLRSFEVDALFVWQPASPDLAWVQSEGWLGGRDSNPDTVVQSHVSYRWTTSQCAPVGRMNLRL